MFMALAVDDTAKVDADMQASTRESADTAKALEEGLADLRRQLVSCEMNIKGESRFASPLLVLSIIRMHCRKCKCSFLATFS